MREFWEIAGAWVLVMFGWMGPYFVIVPLFLVYYGLWRFVAAVKWALTRDEAAHKAETDVDTSAQLQQTETAQRPLLDPQVSATVPTTIKPQVQQCPKCGSGLVQRTNRKTYQKFVGCSGFPVCRFTR